MLWVFDGNHCSEASDFIWLIKELVSVDIAPLLQFLNDSAFVYIHLALDIDLIILRYLILKFLSNFLMFLHNLMPFALPDKVSSASCHRFVYKLTFLPKSNGISPDYVGVFVF